MTENRMLGKVLMATVLLTWALVPGTPALALHFPATGQTTAYPADKNDGILGPVPVPNDGTLRWGAPLRYKDNGDGTITDLNTALTWEKKCSCGGLHDVGNVYVWSGDGLQETISDWLDAVNAEGGTGYASHNDWRIPNVRELESIADYGWSYPSINLAFGPTAPSFYWSSTTGADDDDNAWLVVFDIGFVSDGDKSGPGYVRAVRGGHQ